ncbi:MAG: hypothetical protein AUH29_13485 [Candidatus Rokubacteria bacterium 13_1_40CM_69_27]|nr:MAG: hypothetical protein AUH29_13485 [Candidatus Rokubacteria bacterium 13_1_40CM_69_27]
MVWTTLLWLFGTVAYAYTYILHRVSLPDAVGYEADWSWQLFFFSLVRLPLLIAGLVAVLCLERVLWSRWGAASRAA